MKSYIYLENGRCFEGKQIGFNKNTVSEIVFNTSMTGYQEVLTDPSYYGQSVVMTYPLIGNYGINLEDHESEKIHVSALIVGEECQYPNNHRCEISLNDYLMSQEIPCVCNVDTRALTKEIRKHGSMKCIISNKKLDEESLNRKINNYQNSDAVKCVSSKSMIKINPSGKGKRLALMDYGIKKSIIHYLVNQDCVIDLYPHDTSSDIILNGNYDGLFLSNGPGDPRDLGKVVEHLKMCIGKIKIRGICLGHQLIALACGGEIEKMKFGHRGGNHPVIDLKSRKITITSQNHSYCVTKVPSNFKITHVNVNDQTVEGMENLELDIKTVQYHPEASPGPFDANGLFADFIESL